MTIDVRVHRINSGVLECLRNGSDESFEFGSNGEQGAIMTFLDVFI